MKRTLLVLLVLGLASRVALADSVAVAEPPPEPDATGTPGVHAHAVRRSGAIFIDGSIDDAGWKDVPVNTGFVQRQPDEGKPPANQTQFQIVYDDRAMYVAVRCWDSKPSEIRGLLTRRDQDSQSDWVMIGFDSYHDRRTAYVFGLNAAGVQRDIIIYDDTTQDDTWDAVWSGATHVDSKGWTAEFRIPLSQLRFTGKPDQDWGFQIVRLVPQRGEMSSWSLWPRASQHVVSFFGTLDSIHGLKPGHRIEILPYASTGAAFSHPDSGDPFGQSTAGRYGGGLDVKYGLSSAFTLAATINPDFGQVEADPSQVNLSGQQLFFPEKRPFFLEGTDVFQWSLSQGGGNNGEGLFYTRRIGAPPHLSGTDYAAYAKQTDATAIYGAAKITGKTQGGWTLGLVEALTAQEDAQLSSDAPMKTLEVEPLTNYMIGRVRKDLRQGRTTIAGIFTAVNRRLDQPEVTASLHDQAYTGGIDLDHRFHKEEWQASAKLYGSYVHGSTDAILDDQTSIIRLYQRPDATHVHVDPRRTSLSGAGLQYNVGRWNNPHVNFALGGDIRTPGLELNDVGFQNGADQILTWGWMGYHKNEPTDHVLSWGAEVNPWVVSNFEPLLLGEGASADANVMLTNYWMFSGGVNLDQGRWNPSLLRGGPRYRAENHGNAFGTVMTDSRKKVYATFNVYTNYRPISDSYNGGGSAQITVQARSNLDLTIGPSLDVTDESHQYVDQEPDPSGKMHYIFARIHEVVTSLTVRAAYTFSPRLSLQFYAQPFIASGAYSEYKDAINTYADHYRDRWHFFGGSELQDDGTNIHLDTNHDGVPDVTVAKPDFDVRDLRSNLVLRWEYRPGSTVFLIWSHDRESSEVEGDYRFGHDLSQLASARGEHVVMIKANYWIGL